MGKDCCIDIVVLCVEGMGLLVILFNLDYYFKVGDVVLVIGNFYNLG